MNKNWLNFEKTVAVFQFIFGLLILPGVFYFTYTNFDYYFKTINNNFSIVTTLQNIILNLALPIFGIYSAIKIIQNKKIGWLFSIIYWITLSFYSFIDLYKSFKNSKSIYEIIFLIILTVFFITIGILISSKKFRIKYKFNSKDYIVILVLILVFILKKLYL